MSWSGARALTAAEDAPSGVATDGSVVLFTTGRNQVGENAIRAASPDGSQSRIVVRMPGGLIPNGGLAIDGNDVYVAAESSIVRVPVAGGAATVVVDHRPAMIQDVVVSGDQLWWTTYQQHAPERVEVARMPKAGGPVEVIAVNVATALGRPFPDGDSALLASPGAVLRVWAGQPPTVVMSSDTLGGSINQLALDRVNLYLLTAGNEKLWAVPRSGGAPVRLADGLDSSKGLALVGDQLVFFASSGGLGSSGRDLLRAVPAAAGAVRTVASGRYADGDLAAVGTDRVAFSADGMVWIASIRP